MLQLLLVKNGGSHPSNRMESNPIQPTDGCSPCRIYYRITISACFYIGWYPASDSDRVLILLFYCSVVYNTEYEKKLKAAGVPCELYLAKGAVHGFCTMPG